MKYMGSKRMMLRNGLGELLEREARNANRFVDLFAGSGAVAIYVAQRLSIKVLAYDLQRYSAVITGAILHRQARLRPQAIWREWYRKAEADVSVVKIPAASKLTRAMVADLREWSNQQKSLPITRSYGGHYFSPEQTVWIDALRAGLPKREPAKTVALAALIQAASQCAAAPGHTAQPFQPTRTAKRFIVEAWNKDIVAKTSAAFEKLGSQFAQLSGKARVKDANDAVRQLRKGDLAFIDPPYSGVHYSRFYHVLESIAQGDCGDVSGVGRYPAAHLRPRSRYSLKTESSKALNELLGQIASRGARAILTFPDHACSNGLSGVLVRGLALRNFHTREILIESKFSTLGGSNTIQNKSNGRAARQHAKELILVLNPK